MTTPIQIPDGLVAPKHPRFRTKIDEDDIGVQVRIQFQDGRDCWRYLVELAKDASEPRALFSTRNAGFDLESSCAIAECCLRDKHALLASSCTRKEFKLERYSSFRHQIMVLEGIKPVPEFNRDLPEFNKDLLNKDIPILQDEITALRLQIEKLEQQTTTWQSLRLAVQATLYGGKEELR